MKIAKWGDSLAVRLPPAIIEQLSLQEGDEIEITATGHRQLEVSRAASREDALARMRALSWPLPPGYKFDRGEIYDRPRGAPDDPDES